MMRHFLARSVRVALVAMVLVLLPTVARGETWTDSTGSFSVEATYLGVEERNVVLRKSDGSVIRVPIDRMSAASRSAAKRLYDEQNQAAANLPQQGQRRHKARQHRQQEPGDEQLEQSGGGTHEQVNNQTRGASTVFSSEVSRSSTPWPLMATSGATCTRCRSTGSTARFTSAGVM